MPHKMFSNISRYICVGFTSYSSYFSIFSSRFSPFKRQLDTIVHRVNAHALNYPYEAQYESLGEKCSRRTIYWDNGGDLHPAQVIQATTVNNIAGVLFILSGLLLAILAFLMETLVPYCTSPR